MRGPLTALVGIGAIFLFAYLDLRPAAMGGVFLMGIGIGIWLEHDPK